MKKWLLTIGGIAAALILVVLIYQQHQKQLEGMSPAEAQEVYDNLLKYTGIPSGMMPKLVVLTSPKINAEANSSTWEITIFTGMLHYLRTKDELAAVLSHEIGHIMMQHSVLNPDGTNDNMSMIHEGNADKFGVYLMLRANYDPCQAKNLWERLRQDGGDYEINSDHPNYSYRIWQFEFPYCGGY